MTGQGIRLSTLLERCGIEPMSSVDSDPMIRNVQLDSRKIEHGDLFCALKGLNLDGESTGSRSFPRQSPPAPARSLPPGRAPHG